MHLTTPNSQLLPMAEVKPYASHFAMNKGRPIPMEQGSAPLETVQSSSLTGDVKQYNLDDGNRTENKRMALAEHKLHARNNIVVATCSITDKPYSTISKKLRTINDSATSFKSRSASYLPVENDHVQSILHQCGSYGVEFPIQTKLNHLPGELQGESDPLLQKALMLTAMYDSNNIEALTNNHDTRFHPESIETVNMASKLAQDFLVSPTTPPLIKSSNIVALTKNHNIQFQPEIPKTLKLSSELVDYSLPPPTTHPLNNTSSDCCSNCTKCIARLAILAKMQKQNSATSSLNVDYEVSNNTSLVQEYCPVQATGLKLEDNECEDDEKNSPNAKKIAGMLVSIGDRVDKCDTGNLHNPNGKNNIKNNDECSSSNSSTTNKKSFEGYLPIDNGHLQAILEHGQAFGISFPIQTKLKGNLEAISDIDRIKESVQKKLNRHRVFMNRPQTKDIERWVCSSSKAPNRGDLQQHCTCSNCRQMAQNPSPYCKSIGNSPADFTTTSYVSPELPLPKVQQHHPKVGSATIPVKGGADGAVNLLYFAGAPGNETPAMNTEATSMPKSQAIMNLLKKGGGGDALRAIISHSTPFQNLQEKRPFSAVLTEKRFEKLTHKNKKRCSHPWGMLMKKR